MGEGLARTVMHRHRYSRQWGLGDRKSPASLTPSLVLMDDDVALPLPYAPFSTSSTSTLPATLEMNARGAFVAPEFSEIGPSYSVGVGHVLPPSLEDANAGEVQGTSSLLPVSWQRMNHDEGLLEPSLSPDIVVLTDAVQLAGQGQKLSQAILALKQRFPGALLWAPGIGGPDNVALLTLMGVDLFDMARSREACANEALLTQQGPRFPLDHEAFVMEAQAYHWMKALDEVRAAMIHGTLSTLAERQSLSSPKSVEHLRHHRHLVSQQHDALSSHVKADQLFACFSESALHDPLVEQWEHFMTSSYQTPEPVREVMILLPCSARKPYRLSKTHSRFIRAIQSTGCHEVMMTSPLGLVPRDLEDVWPASNYDVPVTGDWSLDELARVERMLKSLVKRIGYKRIINHTNLDLGFLEIEVVNTREGRGSTNHDALQDLTAAVKDAVTTYELRNQKNSHRLLEHFKSIARKTMKNDEWCEKIVIRGKLPRWRLELDGQQIAVWSIDRNGFSFSRASIDLLAQHDALPKIHLVAETVWKGDVFSQMVQSYDPMIRCGDDLLVYQNGTVIGLARAIAPGWEWAGTPGTLAKSHQRKKMR